MKTGKYRKHTGKYRNKKTNGYASKHEARCAAMLKAMERAGLISDLREQVPFELVPKCGKERAVKYVADFVFVENGETIVADAKGVRTREYIIKRKLMNWRHGIPIREI